jgi:hypothetical protein
MHRPCPPFFPRVASTGRRRVTKVCGLGLLAGLFLFPLAVRAQFSDFSISVSGWQVVSFNDISANNFSIVGTYAPTYFASGGDPGGYIYSTDPDGGDFTFSAPAAFLGNKSAAFGSTLTYSLNDTSSVNYNTTDVILMGGGVTLLWQQSPTLVPGPSFTTVTVPLAPTADWHLVGGSLASAGDFTTVLGNLTGIYIRGEYAFGPDSTGLDTVNFAAVPEPETWALLLAGLLALGAVTRRRRSKTGI